MCFDCAQLYVCSFVGTTAGRDSLTCLTEADSFGTGLQLVVTVSGVAQTSTDTISEPAWLLLPAGTLVLSLMPLVSMTAGFPSVPVVVYKVAGCAPIGNATRVSLGLQSASILLTPFSFGCALQMCPTRGGPILTVTGTPHAARTAPR